MAGRCAVGRTTGHPEALRLLRVALKLRRAPHDLRARPSDFEVCGVA